MAHVNNIYGIRVNTIANNGSVNFGNVIHKGHQSNVKANIGFNHSGDAFGSPVSSVNKNAVNDPDGVDQQQNQI